MPTLPSVACLTEMVASFRRTTAAMNHGDDGGLTRRLTGDENDEEHQPHHRLLVGELLNEMRRWNNSPLARGLRYRPPPPPPIGIDDIIRSREDVLGGSGYDFDNVMSNNDNNKTEGDEDDDDDDGDDGDASIDYTCDHGTQNYAHRRCNSNDESIEELDDDNDGTEVPGTNLSPLQYSRMNLKRQQSLESSCGDSELSNEGSIVHDNESAEESETLLPDVTSEVENGGSDEYYGETEVPGTQQYHPLLGDIASAQPKRVTPHILRREIGISKFEEYKDDDVPIDCPTWKRRRLEDDEPFHSSQKEQGAITPIVRTTYSNVNDDETNMSQLTYDVGTQDLARIDLLSNTPRRKSSPPPSQSSQLTYAIETQDINRIDSWIRNSCPRPPPPPPPPPPLKQGMQSTEANNLYIAYDILDLAETHALESMHSQGLVRVVLDEMKEVTIPGRGVLPFPAILVTHGIAESIEGMTACYRSYSYLKAVALGALVVDARWLVDSMDAGILHDCNVYKIERDVETLSRLKARKIGRDDLLTTSSSRRRQSSITLKHTLDGMVLGLLRNIDNVHRAHTKETHDDSRLNNQLQIEETKQIASEEIESLVKCLGGKVCIDSLTLSNALLVDDWSTLNQILKALHANLKRINVSRWSVRKYEPGELDEFIVNGRLIGDNNVRGVRSNARIPIIRFKWLEDSICLTSLQCLDSYCWGILTL